MPPLSRISTVPNYFEIHAKCRSYGSDKSVQMRALRAHIHRTQVVTTVLLTASRLHKTKFSSLLMSGLSEALI